MLKWSTRILALIIILFGIPFYFGYGNPLPFIKREYTLWDNAWLIILPIMFIGLGLGWKFPFIGGILITIPILVGFLIGIFEKRTIGIHMIVPFFVGILYIITGFVGKTK